jgi:twitching motility protein PilJ
MADATKSQLSNTRNQLPLLILAAVFMIVAVGAFFYIQFTTDRNRNWLDLARSFSAQAQGLEKAGRAARPDFAALATLQDNVDAGVQALRNGDSATGIEPVPDSVKPQLDALAKSWATMRQSVGDILANERAYKRVADNLDAFNASAEATFEDYNDIAGRLGTKGAPTVEIVLAAGQLVRLQQIEKSLGQIVYSGRDAKTAAESVARLAGEFADRHRQLASGTITSDAALDASAKKAAADFATIATAAPGIGQDASAIAKLQTAAANLQSNSADVGAAAKALEQALQGVTGNTSDWGPYVVYFSGFAAALCFAGLAALFYFGLRARLREAESKDAQQQQAILTILDEITNLANGDLTVDVTVTEDFTGAIADSINYTVQTLRGLVGTINQTSERIVTSAASTQDTAARMSQNSDRQARDVTSAASLISAMSRQIQEVAASAENIAVQAQGSVEIAHNGASTVGRTITNMAALREQIQDTAKRIKRLGESSQEIGNIIEFITDIAEQTNTLALNASIQAAMAGEAGRGFAVVADEVQRLAERAGSATRQIENLVKTIQADTNEAIISMERSTTNVVAGAKSAEEAGQALTRIESSSQELAKSVQEISLAARGQSAEATKIAGTMQGIREIAVQTSGSANSTAKAIGELNALSDQLRESVAGFKLPERAAA